MYRTICLALLFFMTEVFNLQLFAKEIKYPVSSIPETLKSNARAVVRRNDIVFEVTSISSAKLTVDFAITILNKNAVDDSYFSEYYDKFTRISNIQASVYDINGLKIKRISADEILDFSAISGFSIYEDDRVKSIDPGYRTVPFTVEYHYEMYFNGLVTYPSFNPYPDYEVAVESSSFKVIVPAGSPLRYYEQNMNTKGEISDIGNWKMYTWKEENLKALRSEPFCVPTMEYIPMVVTAPTEFEIDGYKGNAVTWENYGSWINRLNEGRDALPESLKSEILNLISNAGSTKEKVEILYQYLQDNSRYVNIKLGIGGLQPIPAETVARLKYGDCKALTNYMKAVLETAGIKSYYTLVNALSDASRLKKDFSTHQFNHVFLCVPVENDTLWLECTSQHDPCGYLGTFTDDRDVLLITENGGKVVHTTAYYADDNQQIRTAVVDLAADGGGKASLNNMYIGIFYDDLQQIILSDDADKKKLMSESIDIPSFQLIDFNLKEVRKRIPSVIETVDLQLNNYATVMGSRLLLPLNLMTKEDLLPRKREERRSDILIRRAYTNIDTVIYTIPEFYKLEGLPKNDGIKSDFGEYWYKTEQNGDKIIYIRYFRMNKGQYDKLRYEELYTFIEKISVMDKIKASLIKI